MSMVAAPRPIMIPVISRPAITLRAASSQTGPTCAATRNPSPKPVSSAVVMAGQSWSWRRGTAPNIALARWLLGLGIAASLSQT